MSNSISVLQADIELKIKRLKDRNARLEKENATQKDSIFSYLELIDNLRSQVRELKEGQIASTFSKDQNKDQVKMLDQYIRLIDKAIASIQSKA